MYRLPALHALSGKGFSESETQSVFGPCSRIHGHDYHIEVTVEGPIDPQTGMLIRREDFDGLISEALIHPYRGRNLSDFFDFTTGEALSLEFFKLLQPLFQNPLYLRKVKVHETAKNSFIFPGS